LLGEQILTVPQATRAFYKNTFLHKLKKEALELQSRGYPYTFFLWAYDCRQETLNGIHSVTSCIPVLSNPRILETMTAVIDLTFDAGGYIPTGTQVRRTVDNDSDASWQRSRMRKPNKVKHLQSSQIRPNCWDRLELQPCFNDRFFKSDSLSPLGGFKYHTLNHQISFIPSLG
jgi:hypothetical protein